MRNKCQSGRAESDSEQGPPRGSMQDGHTVRRSRVWRPELKAHLNPCEPLALGTLGPGHCPRETILGRAEGWAAALASRLSARSTSSHDSHRCPQTSPESSGNRTPQVTHCGSKASVDPRSPHPFKHKHWEERGGDSRSQHTLVYTTRPLGGCSDGNCEPKGLKLIFKKIINRVCPLDRADTGTRSLSVGPPWAL